MRGSGAGAGVVRARKALTLFISSMDNIIRIIKSLENSVKHEIKKTRRWITLYFVSTYGCLIDSTYGFFIDRKWAWKSN